MTKQEVQDIVAKLCGALSDLGCIYEVTADNRSNRKSQYIYIRKPTYAEIRVSDHPPVAKRKKQFDVGPHGMTVEAVIDELRARLR